MTQAPPSRGATAVLVIGVLLACVGVAAVGGALHTVKKRSAAERAATVALPTASFSASATAPAAAVTVADADVAPELPPLPGTPAASLKARPSWADDLLSEAGTHPYAPQLGEPLGVYLAASSMRGDVDHGFVICRVQTFGHADIYSGDDVHAQATFGSTPEVAGDGPDNANLAFASAPLVMLEKADTVRFDVYDRDVTELESITHGMVDYDGHGLSTTDPGANIECRALSGDALKRVAREHGSGADRAIAALKATKLDTREADRWGFPSHYELTEAARKIGDVAALVGWDDVRVTSPVASFDAATSALEATRKRLFDELYAKSADDGDAGPVHIHFVELLCGASVPRLVASKPTECVAHLTLRNTSAASVTLSRYASTSGVVEGASHLVTEQGPAEARLYDSTGADPFDVAAKTTTDAYMGPRSLGSYGGINTEMEGQTLANVCFARLCAWVKVK